MATGKELKRLRGKKSATEIAALIGVGVDRMRKWEERDVDPSDSGDIAKVESYFGTTLDGLKALKSFDFVENPSKQDYRDRYINSLEKQVRTLEDQLSLATGQLRHVLLLTHALAETNQDALIQLMAKQKIGSVETIDDQLSTANSLTYQKMKDELGIVEPSDIGRRVKW